jgi:hypothetical protein
VSGQVEAMIIKTRLEAENIPVHLSYESTVAVYGFSSTNLGRVQIMVPAPFESAARIICKTDTGKTDTGKTDTGKTDTGKTNPGGDSSPASPENSPEDSGNRAA